MMRFLPLLAALWTLQATSETTEADIRFLLNHVASATQCTFIRNGKPYTSAEALEHITRKYNHYRNRIDSAESFIELSASRSLISRRPYWIECEGEEKVKSAEWLAAALSAHRESSHKSQ